MYYMKETKVYEGKILGLSIYDGKIKGKKIKREVIKHRGAAAMLAFDEDKKVILVKQYRFPHGYVLENSGRNTRGKRRTYNMCI